jgi:hypothetical protein
MSYHRFKSEDGSEYGLFEVFYKTDIEIRNDWDVGRQADGGERTRDLTGWYWWACFPGCLPDGEPQGPYESETEAIQMAQAEA